MDFYKECIKEAAKSEPEDNRLHPKVGVLAVKGRQVFNMSHRGEIARGEHAEFTLLERKLQKENLHEYKNLKLYITLEPCVERNPPKTPCAERIVQRGIRKVHIGILDPNPKIYGNGVWLLNKNGVKIYYFPRKRREEITKMNQEFIKAQAMRFDMVEFLSLLPKTFIDPDEPFLDAAYALFRNYEGDTIVVFNTKLKMFNNLNEFHAWWVNGIFENRNIKNVWILAPRDIINEKILNSDIKDTLKREFENRKNGQRYLVMEIQAKEPMYKGIFFINTRNPNPQVDFILSDLEISLKQLLPGILSRVDKKKGKRVMLVASRAAEYIGSFKYLRRIYLQEVLKNEDKFKPIQKLLDIQ